MIDQLVTHYAWMALAFAVVFVALGVLVAYPQTSRLDTSIAALRGVGTHAAIVMTRLGFQGPLAALSAAGILGALVLRTGVTVVVLAIVAHTAAQLAIMVIKPLFKRVRPVEWLYRQESGFSYPSGHSATAVTFYLCALLLVDHSPLGRPIQIVVMSALALCIIGIPLSRIVLGAHHFTDVVGGLCFGAAWLCACLSLFFVFGPHARHRSATLTRAKSAFTASTSPSWGTTLMSVAPRLSSSA